MRTDLPTYLQRLIDDFKPERLTVKWAHTEGIHDAYKAMMENITDKDMMSIYGRKIEILRNTITKRDEKIRALELKVKGIQALVNEQAEDEGLWFIARHATEDYLQRALRKLHEIIEREDTHE